MKNFNFVDCSFYTEVYSLQRKMGAFSALQRKKAQKILGLRFEKFFQIF